ncbi:MAG: hypothetical protein ABIT96_02810 [Ferruginibacter sp.]
MKNIFFALIMCMLFSPIVTMAQEGDEPKEKVEKVTEKLLQEQTQSDSPEHTEDTQTKKDFAEITKAVEKGTVPTIIKVISLAVIIAGFAILYLPRKKKEVSNG